MPEHDPKAVVAAPERAVGPGVGLSSRPMFGGVMDYAGGRPFASVSRQGLALKLPPAERDGLLALPGAKPLRYEAHDPPSKSYTLVPDAMLADPSALRPWVERSAAFAAALPAARSRRRYKPLNQLNPRSSQ